MSDASLFDMLLTFFIIAGIFLLAYMTWRQQGILETVNEIRDSFKEHTTEVIEGGVYK